MGSLKSGSGRLRSALRHATASRAATAARVMLRLTPAPIAAQLREATVRLEGLAARLESVSYMKVLERGFALVTDPRGVAISSAASVKPGADLRLRFADGEVRAKGEGRQGALLL